MGKYHAIKNRKGTEHTTTASTAVHHVKLTKQQKRDIKRKRAHLVDAICSLQVTEIYTAQLRYLNLDQVHTEEKRSTQ